MRTETIFQAIAALRKANEALTRGNLDITAQIQLGGECFGAAFHLERELVKDVPEVKAVGTRDKAVSTGPGDLDVCGRELKPGS